MTRLKSIGTIGLAFGAAALLFTSAAAQAPSGIAKPWTMPRTPDGKPDLQGNWTNVTLTPLERPDGMGPVLTKEQAANMEKGVTERIERLAKPSDPNREAPPVGGDGSTGAAGMVGGYNNFWIDSGTSVAKFNGELRSSLIVDPPNGKVPPTTEAYRKAAAARAASRPRMGQYDNPENRPLGERCIVSFGSNAGPPMLPNGFYNNNYTIVQTADHVMILTEMVHDVRIIRLEAPGQKLQRLPKNVRPWFGDSIGRWEGDTLVVETTNFHPLQSYRGASENLKVTERFTRADADTINYKFTVDDPTVFTQPFSGEVPFEKLDDLVFEYACHEGNYAMSNILSGARSQERATEEAAKKKQQQ
jgi:hypothetical protein